MELLGRLEDIVDPGSVGGLRLWIELDLDCKFGRMVSTVTTCSVEARVSEWWVLMDSL